MHDTSIGRAATAGTSSLTDLLKVRDDIMARNRALYAGFTMKDGDGDGGTAGGQSGSGGSGTGGSDSAAGGSGGQGGSSSGGSSGQNGSTGAGSGSGDDGKGGDDPLGPGGMKALQAERDGRKQLEQQIQQLQQSQKDQMVGLAKVFGFEPDNKTSTDDLVTQLQQQMAEMTHNADVDRIARSNNISSTDDIELLRSAKDAEQMEKLAARLKVDDQQQPQKRGTPRPDPSVGRGHGNDNGATPTVSSGRDLFKDRHKKN